MGILTFWKKSQEFVSSQFAQDFFAQGQPISIVISTESNPESDELGTIAIQFRNMSTIDIHEIYCDLELSDGLYLFHRGMHIGSTTKHWKIHRLQLDEMYSQSFVVKTKRLRGEPTLTLSIHSMSSTVGGHQIRKKIEIQSKVKK